MRRGKDGKLLLLKCSNAKGKIALGMATCSRWHILTMTQQGMHPGCVEISLGDRGYTTVSPPSYANVAYRVTGYSGEFRVRVRWNSGHSPYPEIKDMQWWVFGIDMGSRSFPKANDDFVTVAKVRIDADGHVFVNGRDAGVWQEFVDESVMI